MGLKSPVSRYQSCKCCIWIPSMGGDPWWLRWSRICLQCRRPGFNPWCRKTPWRREWLPTPVFLHGEFHEQKNLVGHSPWGRRVRHDSATNSFTFIYTYIYIDRVGGQKYLLNEGGRLDGGLRVGHSSSEIHMNPSL